MSIKQWLLVILVLFCSADAYGQPGFSWEMYFPALMTRCRPHSLAYCMNQVSCEGRGGYWYQDSCHAEPGASCSITRLDLCVSEQTCSAAGGYWYEKSCHAEPLACNAAHFDLCLSEQECIAAGGYWYGNTCNPEQSANAVNTAKLAGDWYFVMNFDVPGQQFIRTFAMDGMTVKEDPVGSGTFTIAGIDQDDDPVSGKYVQANDNYTMYVTKSGAADILYEFTFSSPGDVTGCYYLENEEDGTYDPCIPMQGTRL